MNLLIDIGGTSTRLTTSQNSESFSEPTKISTNQVFKEAISDIADYITNLDQLPSKTIISIPGPLNESSSRLITSPNLPQWQNQPLKEEVSNLTKSEVVILNDADLGALGEATRGAGQSYSNVIFLTISTGIGGGRIINGVIDPSISSLEPGHQIIDAGGSLCPTCPKPTTLEHLIGGASTEKKFGMHPKDIQDKSVWEEMSLHLAYGLNNIVNLLAPEAIILGGPMMKDIKIERVDHHFKKIITPKRPTPPVIAATLGDSRSLYGALTYLDN